MAINELLQKRLTNQNRGNKFGQGLYNVLEGGLAASQGRAPRFYSPEEQEMSFLEKEMLKRSLEPSKYMQDEQIQEAIKTIEETGGIPKYTYGPGGVKSIQSIQPSQPLVNIGFDPNQYNQKFQDENIVQPNQGMMTGESEDEIIEDNIVEDYTQRPDYYTDEEIEQMKQEALQAGRSIEDIRNIESDLKVRRDLIELGATEDQINDITSMSVEDFIAQTENGISERIASGEEVF